MKRRKRSREPRRRKGETDGRHRAARHPVRTAAAPAGSSHSAPVAGSVLAFDRASLVQIDRLCVEQYGLPTLALMENAGANVAAAALGLARQSARSGVLVCCGSGNNGGDGLVAARHLHNAGLSIAVLITAEPEAYRGDAAVHLSVVRRMGLHVAVMDPQDPAATLGLLARDLGEGGAGVVVDAVLGTGLDRPVSGSLAGLIAAMNRLHDEGARVVAVDLPSGMDCDSGVGMVQAAAEGRRAVTADLTVSLVGMKLGFVFPASRPYVGEVMVADIGVPAALRARFGRPVRPAGLGRPEGVITPPARRRSRTADES